MNNKAMTEYELLQQIALGEDAISDDLDEAAFRRYFAQRYGADSPYAERPLDAVLQNLGLGDGRELNLAGLMLFGRNPQFAAIPADRKGKGLVEMREKQKLVPKLRFPEFREAGEWQGKRLAGSGLQNLNADIIKLLPVSFPSKKEQQKIADCLAFLDNFITAQTQQLDALKAHKKGLMQQLFPVLDEVAA